MLAVVFVVGAVVAFGATGADDSYITFDASAALADTGRLVSPNGDWVEQSTSVLLVVAIALGHAITGLQIPAVGWLLSLTGGVLTLLAAHAVMRRYRPELALVAVVSIAVTPNIVYWSLSGMEMTLAAACVLVLALAVDATERGGYRAAVTAGVLGIVLFLLRPDQGLLCLLSLSVVLAWFAVRRFVTHVRTPGVRLLAIAAVVLGMAIVAISVAREIAFGRVLPQPVMTKSGAGFSLHRALHEGLPYVVTFLTEPWAVVAAVLLVLCLAFGGVRRLRRGQLFLLTFGVLSLAAVASSRGDWMEEGRMLVSATAALLVLTWTVVPRSTPRRLLVAAAALLIGSQVVTLWSLSRDFLINNGSSVRARWSASLSGASGPYPAADIFFNRWNGNHLADSYLIQAIVPTITRALDVTGATAEHPLTIGSGDAGMTVYYLHQLFGNRIRLIDQWQLAGTDFSRCPGLATTSAGTYVDLAYWKAHAGGCAPPLPDMVINHSAAPPAVQSDFRVVVVVSGTMRRAGGQVPFHQELSVSTALAARMSGAAVG